MALNEKNNSLDAHKPLVEQQVGARVGGESAAPKNAFTFLMQSAKRKGPGDVDRQQKRERPVGDEIVKNDEADIDMADQHSREEETIGSAEKATFKKAIDDRKAGKWGAWAQELRNIALHPEKHSPAALEVTKEAVVIADKFAKGKKHLLVIARTDGLDSIEDVGSAHLPVLKHMHALGESWARRYIDEDPTLVFRLGYHWVPSMRQLHMHVISQDFDSPHLKNKKHWNTFTTGFFRDSQDVLADVEEKGQVMPCGPAIEERFLRMELRCHQCRSAQPNMPRLKTHLLTCKAPLERPYLITSA